MGIIPGGNKLQMHGMETAKPQDPRNSHILDNPLLCSNWMHTQISAPGVVTHYMQRDFNALLGNSNVRYVTSLVISLPYVIKKVKANNQPILFT